MEGAAVELAGGGEAGEAVGVGGGKVGAERDDDLAQVGHVEHDGAAFELGETGGVGCGFAREGLRGGLSGVGCALGAPHGPDPSEEGDADVALGLALAGGEAGERGEQGVDRGVGGGVLDQQARCGHDQLRVVGVELGQVCVAGARPRHRPQPPQRGLAHVRDRVVGELRQHLFAAGLCGGPRCPPPREGVRVGREGADLAHRLARRDRRECVKRPRRCAPIGCLVADVGDLRPERAPLRIEIGARAGGQTDRGVHHVGVRVAHGGDDRGASRAWPQAAVVRGQRLDAHARVGVGQPRRDRVGGCGSVPRGGGHHLAAHAPVRVLQERYGGLWVELVAVRERSRR